MAESTAEQKSFIFDLELFDNHMIALFSNNMRVLIDTGSPSTVADHDLKIGSKTYHAEKTYSGTSVAKLSELVKYRFDCLLGVQTMKEFLVEIALSEKKFKLHRRDQIGAVLQGDEHVIKMLSASTSTESIEFITSRSNFPGQKIDSIPHVPVNIDGTNGSALIDTGAKISYYHRSFSEAYDVVGEGSDFYPSFGGWTTTLHAIPVTIGDTFITKFGNLPGPLEQAMLSLRTAIIGFDLFNHHERVLIDFQDAKMYLSKEITDE